jgi:hypothetical protein
MPPLGQYFSRRRKPDESIAAPKGTKSRTPPLFPCKPAASWGHDGGHDGDLGPPAGTLPRLARRDGWARAMPPLWQYFLRLQTCRTCSTDLPA